jgi:hypothetical protein
MSSLGHIQSVQWGVVQNEDSRYMRQENQD